MHRHEMQQSNIYLGIYTIEYYFLLKKLGCYSFQRGLLLRGHSDEENLIMLTLFDGGWQRSPATVRQLGRCLVTVRAASGEASAPRTCAEASSSSLLASQPINCSERQRKT
jgi:hypothetical protein